MCEFECDLIRNGKLLAKQRGLDPGAVFCPPNTRAICTETQCPLGELGYDNLETPDNQEVSNKFYKRAGKSLEMIRKRKRTTLLDEV